MQSLFKRFQRARANHLQVVFHVLFELWTDNSRFFFLTLFPPREAVKAILRKEIANYFFTCRNHVLYGVDGKIYLPQFSEQPRQRMNSQRRDKISSPLCSTQFHYFSLKAYKTTANKFRYKCGI